MGADGGGVAVLNRFNRACGCEARTGAGIGTDGVGGAGGGVALLNRSSKARGCEARTDAEADADTGAVIETESCGALCCGRRSIWGLKAVGCGAGKFAGNMGLRLLPASPALAGLGFEVNGLGRLNIC